MSEETTNPVASVDDDGTIKLDLRQNAVQEQSTDEVPVRDEPATGEEVPVENVEETNADPAGEEVSVQDEQPVADVQEVEEPVLEEITEEQVASIIGVGDTEKVVQAMLPPAGEKKTRPATASPGAQQ